jgi:hypothetical protein
MHSGRNIVQASSKNKPLDLDRIDRDYFLPINAPKRGSRSLWTASSLRIAIDAGTRLLLVVGVVWVLYLSGNHRKSAVANPNQQEQLQARATSQPDRPVQKPSPITPVDTAPVDVSVAPQKAPAAVSHSGALSASHYPTMRYEPTRKKAFGGCTGELELTGSRLDFRCPDQADLIFPVTSIAKAHKDGIVLKSGEKYHFTIANRTKDEVEGIFVSWLNKVQQFPQQSRTTSF